MTSHDQFTAYLSLLKIRQSAGRRNVIIAGGLFLFAILSTVAFGLLNGWNGRSVYIIAGFDIIFIVNFLMAWVKLEIVKGSIELMNNLRNKSESTLTIDRAKHDKRSYLASTSPPQVARSGYQGIHASGDHKISSN